MDKVKEFIKKYYEFDEGEFEPQTPFVHLSISDLAELLDAYAGAIWQEQQAWVRVEDVPIVVKVDGRLGINRLVPEEFLAALEVHDSESKETYWWMRHCRINEQGDLRVITDDDDDYCGWAVTDITHWRGLTPPGTVFPASPPGSTPVESKEAAQMVEDIPDYADNMMAEWEELEKREGKYKAALEEIIEAVSGTGTTMRIVRELATEALKP